MLHSNFLSPNRKVAAQELMTLPVTPESLCFVKEKLFNKYYEDQTTHDAQQQQTFTMSSWEEVSQALSPHTFFYTKRPSAIFSSKQNKVWVLLFMKYLFLSPHGKTEGKEHVLAKKII